MNQAAPSAWATCVRVTVFFARLMIRAPVAGRLINSKLGAVVAVVGSRKLCCRAKALDIVGQDSSTMF